MRRMDHVALAAIMFFGGCLVVAILAGLGVMAGPAMFRLLPMRSTARNNGNWWRFRFEDEIEKQERHSWKRATRNAQTAANFRHSIQNGNSTETSNDILRK